MKKNETLIKEPLIHITKRDSMPLGKAIGVRALAIFAALMVTSVVIMILAKENPIKIYASIISGSFGTSRRVWNLLNGMAILLGISLAVTPAFKMKFWNCGAEGQTLIGALACAAVMLFLGDVLPLPALYVVMIVAAMLAAAVWAVIPAIFRALFKTNETLFTLMMNYIAIQLINYCLKIWAKDGSGTLPTMPHLRFPRVLGKDYLLTIIVFFALCIAMYIYLRFSKHGYEISVVGESENTARYIGINVKKVIIRTMILSGAICGIVGLLLVANGSCTVSTDLAGGQGFTAIMVSWLAGFNPLVMFLTSFLIIFLQRGTGQVSTDFRLDTSLCDIITALILFFIIGCEFFINYKINFRKREKGADKE